MSAEHVIRALAEKYDDGDGEASALAADAMRRLAWRRRRGGKVCAACGEAKALSEFGPDDRKPDGLDPRCRPCASDQRRLSRYGGGLSK